LTAGFQLNDKLKIEKKYLTPKILKSVGFDKDDIIFSEDIVTFIIENYTFEGGVRRLKECILEITKEINLRKLTGAKLDGHKIKFPLKITESILKNDIFKKRHVVIPEVIHPYPKIGLVNGLWANDQGVGGLIPIEAFSIPTNNKLELELTGMQGDVMKDSFCYSHTFFHYIPLHTS
jgi:ATP-dependent Lon protease